MTVGGALMIGLLRDLTAESAGIRSRAADSVTDWARTLDEQEFGVVSHVLAWLAVHESDGDARESQVNALAELTKYRQLPPTVLAQLSGISSSDLQGSQIEHVEYLRSLQAP